MIYRQQEVYVKFHLF